MTVVNTEHLWQPQNYPQILFLYQTITHEN